MDSGKKKYEKCSRITKRSGEEDEEEDTNLARQYYTLYIYAKNP